MRLLFIASNVYLRSHLVNRNKECYKIAQRLLQRRHQSSMHLSPPCSAAAMAESSSSPYIRPEVYDIAFSFRDIGTEVEYLVDQYQALSGGAPLRHFLELAAGPARHAIQLAQKVPGACSTAVDAEPAMVDYAYSLATKIGIGSSVTCVHADMKQPLLASAVQPGNVDLAAVLLGSLAHCLDNEAALACLQSAAAALRPGEQLLLLSLRHTRFAGISTLLEIPFALPCLCSQVACWCWSCHTLKSCSAEATAAWRRTLMAGRQRTQLVEMRAWWLNGGVKMTISTQGRRQGSQCYSDVTPGLPAVKVEALVFLGTASPFLCRCPTLAGFGANCWLHAVSRRHLGEQRGDHGAPAHLHTTRDRSTGTACRPAPCSNARRL